VYEVSPSFQNNRASFRFSNAAANRWIGELLARTDPTAIRARAKTPFRHGLDHSR
jgi:hypothetical protein